MDADYFDALIRRTDALIAAGLSTYDDVGLPQPNGTLPPDWLRDIDAMDAAQRTAYSEHLSQAPIGTQWAEKINTYLSTGLNL